MRPYTGKPVSAGSDGFPAEPATNIPSVAIDPAAPNRMATAERNRGKRTTSASTSSTTGSSNSGTKLRPLLPNVPERVKRAPSPLPSETKQKRITVRAACEGCRARKVKCDGVRPSCAACRSSERFCEYSVPEGFTHRDAVRQRMSQVSKSHRDLLKSHHDLLNILDLLHRSPETEAGEILRLFRSAPRIEDAVAHIADASLLLPPGSDTLSSRSSGSASPDGSSPTYGLRCLPFNKRLGSPYDSPEHVFQCLYHNDLPSTLFTQGLDLGSSELLPVSRWTPGFEDDYNLTHLLTLFWTWDNTFSHVIDRQLFLEDLRLADPADPSSDRNHLFCSSFLVLCLLSVSSLYSIDPMFYDVPGDQSSRGARFARAAVRMLDSERKRPSITLLQGVTLLWLYEGSVGDSDMAERYMWEMVDLYFQLGLDQRVDPTFCPGWNSRHGREIQAVSIIIWGLYAFNAKIAVNFEYRFYIPRPKLSRSFEHPLAYLARPKSATSHWCAYPLNTRFQPSHFREVISAECSLAEIAEELMDIIGRSRDHVPEITRAVKMSLESVYNRLTMWRSRLPDQLQPNNSDLPSVLSLHATYELVMIRLLSPLAAKFPRDLFSGSTPSALKLASTFAMINTVWTFRSHYTLRHEYWLMQVCAAAAMAVLFDLNNGSVDVFIRACQALHETGEYVRMANKNLIVIQRLVERYRIKIPDVGRAVRALYFPALNQRQSTPYSDSTRVIMYVPSKDGCEIDNIQVSTAFPTQGSAKETWTRPPDAVPLQLRHWPGIGVVSRYVGPGYGWVSPPLHLAPGERSFADGGWP